MIKLRDAKKEDIEFIKEKIAQFKLDPENLQYNQFIVAEDKGKIAGFGRLKPYKDAVEVGALGVIPEYRKRGIASLIMNELIKRGPKKIYQRPGQLLRPGSG